MRWTPPNEKKAKKKLQRDVEDIDDTEAKSTTESKGKAKKKLKKKLQRDVEDIEDIEDTSEEL